MVASKQEEERGGVRRTEKGVGRLKEEGPTATTWTPFVTLEAAQQLEWKQAEDWEAWTPPQAGV